MPEPGERHFIRQVPTGTVPGESIHYQGGAYEVRPFDPNNPAEQHWTPPAVINAWQIA